MIGARHNLSITRTGARALWCVVAALTGLIAPNAGAQQTVMEVPAQVRGLDIEEHVGQTLPMELTFTNAEGKLVPLGGYFDGSKPAIIALVYYRCPIVCDVILEKMEQTFSDMDYTIGTEFNVLVFSFDHSETTETAAAVKLGNLAAYDRETTDSIKAGWQFHTSDAASVRQLGDALGFRYRLLENNEYGHPVALFVATPQGKIGRYLYGFKQEPRDLKLALMEASEGKLVRTIGERLMNFCYMYDPKAGAYTLQAVRVMQVAGVLTVLGLATLVTVLFIGERVRRRAFAARPRAETQAPEVRVIRSDLSNGVSSGMTA